MTSLHGSAHARGEVVWAPNPGEGHGHRLHAFVQWLRARNVIDPAGYDELLAWSIADLGGFWSSVAEWSGVRWRAEPSASLVSTGASPFDVRWFPGGELNYAELAIGDAERTGFALIEQSQTRPRRTMSWSELGRAVARCRAGLAALGVERGDRVAAYLPNIEESVVAMLATASLGGVWSSCAPEFGTRAVIDRFGQIEPTVLLAVDGYRYGDKTVDRRTAVAAIATALPSLRAVVPIRYLGTGEDGWTPLLSHPPDRGFAPVAFDHPLYVLFSSGTTGLPKPIVHGHGGIALEHLKILALHHDLGAGDRFSWFTTTGWMMWNFLVSGLLVGSTVVLFDGDPASEGLWPLWRLAEEERLEVLGVSASFLLACRRAGVRPGQALDLRRLRMLGSTGSPLPADGYRWVRDAVGSHVHPASTSGGTDVCTSFVGMVPTVAVRAGEITRRLLGCDVRAVHPDGRACAAGEQGELVLGCPMPSMPVGFWGDPGGERFRAAYFEEIPRFWRHGDWITFFDDGACVISGRSDATLNRGGVRLGTSDFYAVTDAVDGVVDSLVVHLEAQDDMGELVLFVELAPDTVLDDVLRHELTSSLRSQLSPRHVPDRIHAVPAVPRTLSGKRLEVPVKRVVSGTPADLAASADSLSVPDALRWFERFAAHGAAPGAPGA